MLNRTEPILVRACAELQRWSDETRAAGRRIALVPTMGALHEGHLSLVQAGYRVADRVIVSIFVNPTQFGPSEDFARYPRDLARDLESLRKVGADVVFTPSVEEIYPSGDATWVSVERITNGLCGRSRPGHFRGVTTVVARLLLAARPHVAIFGEKDYQQLAVIRRMVRDLRFGVEILGGPIVREPDGLAMSSRNEFLSPRARQQATALNAALHEARALVRAGVRDAAAVVASARERIEKEPLAEIDYVELVDADTLEPVREVSGRSLLALAVRFEGTRLIDNTLLDASGWEVG
jgi:pantoate--beta-alanine ligase